MFRVNTIISVMSNILFITILFPYVSIYPLNTDIQPLVGIVSFTIILFLGYYKRLKVQNIDIFFFLITIYSLLSFGNNSDYQLRKTIGLFFAFLIYLSAKNVKQYFSFKVFYYSVWIYFLGALVQIFANGIFNIIMIHFVRAIKTDMSTRGITVFCTEPSFVAWMGIFFIFILFFFKKNYSQSIPKYKLYIVLSISIFLIVASKSGTGILVGISFLILYIFLKFKFLPKIILGSIFSLMLVLFVNSNIHDGRGAALLKKVITSPNLILYDSSAAVRFSQFYIGTLSLFENPLGTGSGSFTTTAKKIYKKYDLDNIIPKISQKRVKQELSSAVSTFAKYTIEMGDIFIIFIIIMFVSVNINIFIFLYIIFSIVFSFPIVFPPIWLLFAIYNRRIKL